MSGAGATVSESVFDLFWLGWPESVTLNVRDSAVTEDVGVPLITPTAEKLRPEGRVPLVRAHW